MIALYTKMDKNYTVSNALGHTDVLYRMVISAQGKLLQEPVIHDAEDEAQYLQDLSLNPSLLNQKLYDHAAKNCRDLPRSEQGLL